MKDINDFIGIGYNAKKFKKIEDNETNCNGLISELDSHYKTFIEDYDKGNFSYKRSKNSVDKFYYKVDFDNRKKDDIIFIKDRGKKFWTHVAKLVNKNEYIHNSMGKNGSNIENISMLKFFNHEFQIYRKKEVIEK